jgi:CRP-like cAMP-binding protein
MKKKSCFYIVGEGRLALVKEKKKDKSPQILHVLEKGDLVGELFRQLPKYSMCDLYLQKKYNPRVPIAVY